ncbi:MAG: fibrobacter succinogenes major paralogous domain-containing protein [Bacteroidia bacterium]
MKQVLGTFVMLCLFFSLSANNIGEKRFSIKKNGKTLRIPYHRNHSLGNKNEAIKRAIIVIHGMNRNADGYYESIVNASKSATCSGETPEVNPLDYTIVISPTLMMEDDIDEHNLGEDYPFWGSSWRYGALSKNTNENPRKVRISSFEVIDAILEKLETNFPNLTHIVITGHSAGGQFTNRYMAIGKGHNKLMAKGKISIEGLVMNPSSYLYMDNKRYDASTKKFQVPTTASSCTGYNEYPYGFEDIDWDYFSNRTAATLRTGIKAKKVYYLLGGNDNDPQSSSLANDCEDNLEGSQRLERGNRYQMHLKKYFGDDIVKNHRFFTIAGIGHSNSKMYKSKKGQEILFGTLVTDIENNCYGAVEIAGITWMAENLKVTKCNDGTQIQSLNLGKTSNASAMYWHDNNTSSANSEKYGPLYNWATVSKCDVCPSGWRVPSESEWRLMMRSWYGKKDEKGNTISPDSPFKGAGLAYAAKQLRAVDNAWPEVESNTNSTGFSALPGGWIWNGGFSYFGQRSAWWAIEDGAAKFAKISRGEQGTWTGNAGKADILYVRCIRE